MSARPNFFLLLGLNPDTPWDAGIFERTLREKRIEWSRQSAGIAKKALVARQNLALIPRIQEIMREAMLREQEAEAARSELVEAKAAEYSRFERQLAFLNAKERIEQEEVDKFIEAYKHVLPAQEIMRRIEVKIGPPDAPQVSSRPTLDASILKSLSDRLQFVQMGTLYEFLRQPRTTTTTELLRIAEGLYPQLVLQSPTAENVAKIELAGLACEIFKSEEMRSRYDESLRQASLTALLTELDDVMGRSMTKEINHKQVLLFLEQAQKAGWKDAEALEKLGEHVRLRKWSIVTPIVSPEAQKILCSVCEQLNAATALYCTKCNQPLFIECPQCSVSVSGDSVACGNCGFAVGNRYLVDSLLEDAGNFLASGAIQQAREAIDEAERAWPSHLQDSRGRQIKEQRRSLDSLFAYEKQVKEDVLGSLGHLKFSTFVNGGRNWLSISWSLPVYGAVKIIKSMQALHREASVLPVSELEQVGQLLNNQENYAVDECSPSTVVYYTPVIVFFHKAYVGVSQPYLYRESVGALNYQQLGPVIRLRWVWPRECEEVLIASNAQRWPRPGDPTVSVQSVKRSEYDKLGYYDIDSGHQDCYIIVTAITLWEKERLPAQGMRLLVRLTSRAVITYEIRRSVVPRGKRTLHLSVSPPRRIPVLLVVVRQDRLPFHKGDGDLLCREQVPVSIGSNIVIDLPTISLPAGTFGKVFFEEDSMYCEFSIHHPSQERMRLS